MRLAVIGGGIAGLSAAWELASAAGGRPDVTVYEPGHLGGKLKTSDFLGRPVDEGPDALLTRVPEGLALCREVGLGEELEATQARRALLFSGGKLRPLPEGLVLGTPARLLPLLRSRILSVGGLGRASLDVILPRSPGTGGDGDVSVFDLVAARLGPEVADRLVEPLLGSIHAGSTRNLSAAATAPQLLAAAQARRSLIAGLKQATRGRQPAAPAETLFVAPRLGMQALADALVGQLRAAGVAFAPISVSALRREQHEVVVEPTGERFDGAVLAVPAPVAFSLLGPVLDQESPPPLAAMAFASVAVVTLGFEAAAFDTLAPGRPRSSAEGVSGFEGVSGVLVAPGSGLLMTACSFGSNKWPHWAAPGTTVLRLSVGRASEQSWAVLDDEALVGRLCEELGSVFGQEPGRRGALAAPLAWRVSRWPASMPQYAVGHLARVASAKAALARHAPMATLAGASYSGVGVPACIGSGRRAAKELLAGVGALELPAS
jgi:oxygen-dependent protoporphyrinogen oxidase